MRQEARAEFPWLLNLRNSQDREQKFYLLAAQILFFFDPAPKLPQGVITFWISLCCITMQNPMGTAPWAIGRCNTIAIKPIRAWFSFTVRTHWIALEWYNCECINKNPAYKRLMFDFKFDIITDIQNVWFIMRAFLRHDNGELFQNCSLLPSFSDLLRLMPWAMDPFNKVCCEYLKEISKLWWAQPYKLLCSWDSYSFTWIVSDSWSLRQQRLLPVIPQCAILFFFWNSC